MASSIINQSMQQQIKKKQKTFSCVALFQLNFFFVVVGLTKTKKLKYFSDEFTIYLSLK